MGNNSKVCSKTQISGWGQTKKSLVNILSPSSLDKIKKIISESKAKSLITRGLGRSYGDAAQLSNSSILDLSLFNKIEVDFKSNTVTAGSGVCFSELLEKLIPLGFFLPVTPGTKNITVGGAVAADIHGKNHHVDGSFANHVLELKIIDGNSKLHKLLPYKTIDKKLTDDYFWATVGGMGLTGVIIEVKFELIPISSSLMKVDTRRFNNIDSLMENMISSDDKYRYSVAWVDSLSEKGRGVLTCGDHAIKKDLNKNIKEKFKENFLFYETKSNFKAPNFIPNGVLNKFTVRAFNETWFRKAPVIRENEFQTIQKFFYPLDGLDNWNNIYGSKGFIQYQFVIPDDSAFLIKHILNILRIKEIPTFLTVLKRFGNSNKGYLSFPKKGWTLAIDIPNNKSNLAEILDDLDKKIASHDGRIYLAKDSRMSENIFKSTYLFFDKWRKIKNIYDPKNIFYSDLANRLSI